ncbi:restriction endonuclease subunit S [Pseudostreptobacillus hongkongensis]|uniref:restriction endonuclease subunit S n=1 Tax=Pseudostreptobacillus hongkongensis TaxID=1162717 RepID=UPI0028D0E50A|nr:restriction endonuclease subunit S [Pseudostreptobacillus hongkongensis]
MEDKIKEIPKEEQPYQLPDGWVWTRLGDIVYLDNAEKKEGSLDYFDVKTLRGQIDPVKKDNGRLVDKNDKVILVDGENSGEVFIIPYKGYMGSTFKKLNFRNSYTEWDYIFLFLLKNKEMFKNSKKGSAIPHLNKDIFKNLEFPLPPLKEQQRITEKLDRIFLKTNRAKEIISKSIEDIENRKTYILDRAFKGVLTSKWRKENKTSSVIELLESINEEKIRLWEQECINAEKDGKKKPNKPQLKSIEEMLVPKEEQPYQLPEGWKWVRTSDIGKWASGGTPSRSNPEFYRNGKIPWVKSGDLNDGIIFDTEEYITDEAIINSSAKIFKKNSIVIAMYGATIGKLGILSRKMSTNQACGVVELSDFVNNNYTFNFFKSIKQLLIGKSKGGAQPNISQEILKNLEFPLPPIEEQKEIVRILESVLDRENRVSELLGLMESISLLEKGILDKAFRGKI